MKWISAPRIEDPGASWLPGIGDLAVMQVLLAAGLGALALALVWWIRRDRRPWIVVDGSNVMHWIDDVAQLRTVALVVARLQEAGLRPVVWFDANAGYKLGGRYMSAGVLAQQLALPSGQVCIAPKGTAADPLILHDARRLKAAVVSNDRFRDWQDSFPDILPAARMVRGQVTGGKLKLLVS